MKHFILKMILCCAFAFGVHTLSFAQGFEDFEHSETGSSYRVITWTGNNGMTWIARDARADQVITSGNKAIAIRQTNGKIVGPLTSAQKVAGVGVISFQAKNTVSSGDNSKKTIYKFVCGTDTSTIEVPAMGTNKVIVTSPEINSYDADSIEITITGLSGVRITIDSLYWTAAPLLTDPAIVLSKPEQNEVITGPFKVNLAINNFTLGTDGKLKVTAPFLDDAIIIGSNLELMALNNNLMSLLSGSYSIELELVDLEGNSFNPEVKLIRNFVVDMPNVATPKFTPTPNMYSEAQNVSISCDTIGATIYYTLDNSEPTKLSTIYETPIEVSATTTIKARAYKNGLDSSEVAVANYIIGTFDGLVCNNSFEYWTEEVPNCWNGNKTSTGLNFARCDTSYHSGLHSVELINTSSTHKRFTSQAITVEEGKKYSIDFWAKGSGDIRTGLYLDDALAITYNDYISLTPEWKKYNQLVISTKNTDVAEFIFSVKNVTAENPILLDDVVITEVVESAKVATPKFSKAEGGFQDAFKVEISCDTVGATIYYTLDNSEPTKLSAQYTDSILVNSTVTIKARAYKDGIDSSDVASVTYTLQGSIKTIKAFKALTSGTIEEIKGDMTFVFRSGKNIFVQDTTAGLLVYDNSSLITNSYNEGDVFSGLKGKLSMFSGLKELVPTQNTTEKTSNVGTIAPTVVTIKDIANDYERYDARLVKIENVMFSESKTFTTSEAANITFAEGDTTMVCRNNFKLLTNEITANERANITGFVIINNGTIQICPRENNDIEIIEAVLTPTFEPAGGVYSEAQSVIIKCETDDAKIYYTTDGSDPAATSTLYSQAIDVSDDMTIKAIALKSGFAPSNIATAEYVISTEPIIKATPDSLVFKNSNDEQKVEVISLNLDNDISVAASKYFTVSPATINMNSTDTIVVTFTGDIDTVGTITLTSNTIVKTLKLTADISTGIVCNNGFEYWTAGIPDCWKGDKTNITLTNVVKSDSARTGNYALQLSAASTYKRFTTQAVTVENNRPYQISYWTKGNGTLRTGLVDGRAAGSGYVYTNERVIDNDVYVNYIDTIVAAKDTVNAEFIFSVKSTSGNNNLLIDDVEIIALEKFATVYTITATNGANGIITPSGTISIEEGSDTVFTFTPSADYKIATVTVDDEDVTSQISNNSYTFTNVTDNHTINVTFVETSISNAELTNLNVYPNPSNNFVNISSDENIKIVEIVNVSGQILNRYSVDNNKVSLNIENIESGIYFVRIYSDSKLAVRKFTVEK